MSPSRKRMRDRMCERPQDNEIAPSLRRLKSGNHATHLDFEETGLITDKDTVDHRTENDVVIKKERIYLESATVGKKEVNSTENEIPFNNLYDIDRGNLCLLCGKCFNKEHYLYKHLKQHGLNNLCHECGKCFQDDSSYKQHIQTHNNPNSSTCFHCGKVFKRKSDLEVHMRIHSGIKPYSCDLCGKRFMQAGQVVIHRRIHSNDRPFPCTQCDKRFRDKRSFEVHSRIHSGIKPYHCKECTKSFSDPSAFTRHKIIHSGLRPHKCKECSSAFADHAALYRHIISLHTNRTYTCKICHREFSSPHKLKNHFNIHLETKNFICYYCNKRFGRKVYLISHINFHNKPPLECDMCGRRYSKTNFFRAHMKTHQIPLATTKKSNSNDRTVTKKKILIPDSSLKVSKRKKQTYLMEKRDFQDKGSVVNTTYTKNYNCSSCTKKYRRKSAFNNHLLTHTTSPDYQILKKRRLLSSKRSMVSADEINSSVIAKKPASNTDNDAYQGIKQKEIGYSCQECNQKFHSRHGLKKHCLVHSTGRVKYSPLRKDSRKEQVKENVLEKRGVDGSAETSCVSSRSTAMIMSSSGQQSLEQVLVESDYKYLLSKTNTLSEINNQISSEHNILQVEESNVRSLILESAIHIIGNENSSSSCFQCTSTFSSESELEKHVLSHREKHIQNESDGSQKRVDCIYGINACLDSNGINSQSLGGKNDKGNSKCVVETAFYSCVMINEDSLPQRYYCNMCTMVFHLESDLKQHLESHSEANMDTSTLTNVTGAKYYNGPRRESVEDIIDNETFDKVSCGYRSLAEYHTTNEVPELHLDSPRSKAKVHLKSALSGSSISIDVKEKDLNTDLQASPQKTDDFNCDDSSRWTASSGESKVKSIPGDRRNEVIAPERTDHIGEPHNGIEEAGKSCERNLRKRSITNYKYLSNSSLMHMIDVPSRSSKVRKKHVFSICGRTVHN